MARVALARPERRNALSRRCMRDLTAALDLIATDRSLRVVVLQADGPAFSAGHDLAELVELADKEREVRDLFDDCVALMQTIQAMPQPVIARVHGVATAAGCQLVAACDLAIAADTARFATPGVNIGLFCSTPMVPIARSIGRKRALEMLLTGEMIDAATAAEWGLINRSVPADRLDDEVDDIARRIAAASGRVVALGKRVFYEQDGRTEADAYAITAPVMASNAAMPEAREGMRAFLDKRAPQWPEQ